MKAFRRLSWHAATVGVLICMVLNCLTFNAAAQTFPNKAIRIISPYPPGGATDIFAREIAARISPALGQQVLVENRSGGIGSIGADALAKAAPDGHTIGMFNSAHAANIRVMKLPYDPYRDFQAITLVADVPGVLTVNSSVLANNLQELLALARSKSGQLSYGLPGTLTAGHLAMELVKIQAKVDIVAIPYKGGAPAMADLLGGQVQMVLSSPPAHVPHVKAGKLRALATTGLRRSLAFPDVPTIAEQGFPGFELNDWYGFFAPAKTPREHVMRIYEEVAKVLKIPEVREKFAVLGAETVGSTPDEYQAFFKKELDKLGKLTMDLGIKVPN
jgi:tripartite-type tricarboxylate transporter receptor subunit TctC